MEEGEGNERDRLVFTELPYQVNKARLIEKLAELVRARRIEGIAELRDESDRTGSGSWWRCGGTRFPRCS